MIIGFRSSLNQVSNGMFEAIRRHLVTRGLLIDRRLYTDADDFYAALKAFAVNQEKNNSKLINVRNSGSPTERESTLLNTFFINQKAINPGAIGGGQFSMEDYIDPDDDKRKFQKVIQPTTKDVGYEIRYKADDNSTENLMTEILATVLGERKYIKAYNDDGTEADEFLITYRGTLDMTDGRKLDKRAQYVAVDMIIHEPEVAQKGIPEATDIRVIIDEQTAMDVLDVESFLPDES